MFFFNETMKKLIFSMLLFFLVLSQCDSSYCQYYGGYGRRYGGYGGYGGRYGGYGGYGRRYGGYGGYVHRDEFSKASFLTQFLLRGK